MRETGSRERHSCWELRNMAMGYYSNYPAYHMSTYGSPFHSSPGMALYSDGSDPWRNRPGQPHGGKTSESKPRLAKEEVEQLEAEFQRNPKPNSSVKKGLAEHMGVEVARINNWFQNRRAKAKQEKRTLESERRKSEQSTEDGAAQDESKAQQATENRHDDDPSTAPFPSLDTPTQPSLPFQGALPESDSDADVLELPQQRSTQDVGSAHNSPIAEMLSAQHSAYDLDSYFSATSSCDFPSIMEAASVSPQMSSPLSISVPQPRLYHSASHALVGQLPFDAMDGLPNELGSSAAPGLDTRFFPDGMLGAVKVEHHDLALSVDSAVGFDQFSPESLAQSPPQAVNSSGLQFRSPSAIDIASRRNLKRPAALGVNSLRSASYNNNAGPKTGLEMPRRADVAGVMRRVASANGSMPRGIQKPMTATPRSPLVFERHQELFLRQFASQSPGPGNPVAPPTPSTPMLACQQGIRETTVSSTTSEEDKAYTHQAPFPVAQFAIGDPTLRTPPATPGLMQGFPESIFAGQSARGEYEFSHEETLTTPMWDAPEFPAMSMNIPSYIAQACASQPATPSYPPTTMGPAMFSYPGSNPEYNWSDPLMMAGKLSPGQLKSKQFQFSNMTAHDFIP